MATWKGHGEMETGRGEGGRGEERKEVGMGTEGVARGS